MDALVLVLAASNELDIHCSNSSVVGDDDDEAVRSAKQDWYVLSVDIRSKSCANLCPTTASDRRTGTETSSYSLSLRSSLGLGSPP